MSKGASMFKPRRVERGRKSAKGVIEQYATELLNRTRDHEIVAKLQVIEQIAFRMGWNDIYNKLRYKSQLHAESYEEKWWNK